MSLPSYLPLYQPYVNLKRRAEGSPEGEGASRHDDRRRRAGSDSDSDDSVKERVATAAGALQQPASWGPQHPDTLPDAQPYKDSLTPRSARSPAPSLPLVGRAVAREDSSPLPIDLLPGVARDDRADAHRVTPPPSLPDLAEEASPAHRRGWHREDFDTYPDREPPESYDGSIPAEQRSLPAAGPGDTLEAPPCDTPPDERTRTQVMEDRLKVARGISSLEEGIPSFNHDRNTLTYRGTPYEVLTGDKSRTIQFDHAAVVSIGAAAFGREMLLMNTTAASSRLEETYKAFVDSLPKDPRPPIEAIFKAVSNFIHKEMFPEALTSTYERFLADWEKSHTDPMDFLTIGDSSIKAPLISIEDFIEAKFGVCRHQALVACYFISKLRKEGLIPYGEILHIRETLSTKTGSIGHVWVWYSRPDDGKLYHIDPMFDVTYQFHDDDEYDEACEHYPIELLEKLYTRFIW